MKRKRIRLIAVFALMTSLLIPSLPPVSAVSTHKAYAASGSNPVDSYASLLLHMDKTGGTNAFKDETACHQAIVHGSAGISTDNSKFGGASGSFPGNSWLEFANSPDWNFGNKDFTIDFWVYLNSIPTGDDYPNFATVFHQGPDSSVNQNALYIGSSVIKFVTSDSSIIVKAKHNFAAKTWYHIALVRSGNKFVIYKNGVAIGTSNSSVTLPAYSCSMTIGCEERGSQGFLNGYLDEYRVINGYAAWTSNFTPPDSEYAYKAPVPASITITGTKTETIPGSGCRSLSFSGDVYSDSGLKMMNQTLTWSLKSPVPGVSIDSSTGDVTVESGTKPSLITVVATDGNLSNSVNVSLQTPKSRSETIKGPGVIPIPASGSSTSQYTIQSIDQCGHPMEPSQGNIYLMGTKFKGVTFDPKSGTLTVSSDAATRNLNLFFKWVGFKDVSLVKMDKVYSLSTTDTSMVLGEKGNALYILSLRNKNNNWDWISSPSAVPLPAKVSGSAPNWKYVKDQLENTNNGVKLTVHFTSDNPKLELDSIWQTRAGSGPVETYNVLKNDNGSTISVNYKDLVSANLAAKSDRAVNLVRFDKAPRPTDNRTSIGVFQGVMGKNSTVSGSFTSAFDDCEMPFVMYDVDSTHGMYLGYSGGFCKFNVKTGNSPLNVTSTFYMENSGSEKIADGTSLQIPGMYIGTYTGDIDEGGNEFKNWFWNYEITPTLKNTDEPYVEMHVETYSESGWTDYLNTHDMRGQGVDMVKMDALWSTDATQENWFGWNWTPDPAKWPNGMKFPDIAHSHGLKAALYLGNQYMHCDLSKPTGVQTEEAALLNRFDNWHYDFWRSDAYAANYDNLDSHNGLMQVLDYMIAQRGNQGFRYENCSVGGSMKSFDIQKRMTFVTTNDMPTPESFRQSFYANSYMMNTVQLKSDLNFGVGGPSQDSPSYNAYILYHWRTAMLGAIMSAAYTDQQYAPMAEIINEYKTKHRPIEKGGNVYHVLPICDGINWDGFEFFNNGLNKGDVFLYKPSSSVSSSKTIKLKGLNRTEKYTLTFQDRTSLNCVKTGAELMDQGITVTGMDGDYASEIIWIN